MSIFSENRNPADHADHDPSQCDFARIWLIQQYLDGKHLPILEKLDIQQLAMIGFKTFTESQDTIFVRVFEPYNITLDQLFEFSECVRMYIISQVGDEVDHVVDANNINLN